METWCYTKAISSRDIFSNTAIVIKYSVSMFVVGFGLDQCLCWSVFSSYTSCVSLDFDLLSGLQIVRNRFSLLSWEQVSHELKPSKNYQFYFEIMCRRWQNHEITYLRKGMVYNPRKLLHTIKKWIRSNRLITIEQQYSVAFIYLSFISQVDAFM